jgi:hypothetical protein
MAYPRPVRAGARILPALLVLACAGTQPTTVPSASSSAPPTAEPSASASAGAAGSSADVTASVDPRGLAFPTTAGRELDLGTYVSSPPFDVDFTFEIADPGWESLHLIGEFFDVVRWDGPGRTGAPARSLAFGHPERVRGATDVPVAGLTPAAAVELLAGRDDLIVGSPGPFRLDGRDGLVLDLRAATRSTVLFGGQRGDLGIGPDRDVRLGVVPLQADLLFVVVSAVPGQVDAAWDQAEPILESIEL